MSLWITDDIKNAVRQIEGVTIIDTGLGEDCTTQSITLSVQDSEYMIYVRGFVIDGKRLKTDDNVEIEMVEVSTGYSDGDMPNDPIYVVAHAQVQAALMKLGHSVVKSMDPYF
jgi:hypothetical protein